MEKIKLHFCDFWKCHTYENDFFVNILKDKYDITQDPKDPDFVICSCYGHEYRKYKCPRIFYTGENLTPDFNVYDYAIGFDRLDFGDRYLRVPIYYFFSKIRTPMPALKDPFNRDFCSFLYSNGNYCNNIRKDFFKLLSKYKKVSSGGRLFNNTKEKVKDKIEYLSRFKFTIAFENSSSDGYITEKLYDAFMAHTIPIYWGDENACKDFNPEAFINVSDFSTLEDVVKKVAELDCDKEKYLKMLNTPFLNDGKYSDNLCDEKIISFFDEIFKQKGVIRRKDNLEGWNKKGEFYLYSKFQRGFIKRIKDIILR